MDEKIVFCFVLADNDVDEDGEAFTAGALKKICRLCVGHHGIFDGTTCQAKITDAVVIDSCGTTKDGRYKQFIYASAELPNNEEGRKLLDKIILEKPKASISCSVLNRDKVCDGVTMLSGVTNFYEFSLRFDEEETMTKDEIQRRLEALEKQQLGITDEIQNLKAKLDEVHDEEIPDYPVFANGEGYWFVNTEFENIGNNNCSTGIEYEDFNMFHTKEMAQLFADKCKLIAMLLHCKWYLDRDYSPNWSNKNERKWVVRFDNVDNCYNVYDMYAIEYPTVHFSTKEAAQKAADWLNRRIRSGNNAKN